MIMVDLLDILRLISPKAFVQIVLTENNGLLECVEETFKMEELTVYKVFKLEQKYELEYIAPVDDKTIELHCRSKWE